MDQLPFYIAVVMIVATAYSTFVTVAAADYSRTVTLVLAGWLIVQGIIAMTGFYTLTDSFPPRFFLLVVPPLLFIILLFNNKIGKAFIDELDIKMLMLLHFVRIPVELILYWLYMNKAVPELMTFTGRNFDILSGITAPFIWYFGYVKPRLSKNVLIAWNILCLLLLFNIVCNAALSAPFPFQQFGFDQPNIAVLYFPFVWLPCCIVPLVLFAHVAALRRLMIPERMAIAK
jgi:hypothetical protein